MIVQAGSFSWKGYVFDWGAFSTCIDPWLAWYEAGDSRILAPSWWMKSRISMSSPSSRDGLTSFWSLESCIRLLTASAYEAVTSSGSNGGVWTHTVVADWATVGEDVAWTSDATKKVFGVESIALADTWLREGLFLGGVFSFRLRMALESAAYEGALGTFPSSLSLDESLRRSCNVGMEYRVFTALDLIWLLIDEGTRWFIRRRTASDRATLKHKGALRNDAGRSSSSGGTLHLPTYRQSP